MVAIWESKLLSFDFLLLKAFGRSLWIHFYLCAEFCLNIASLDLVRAMIDIKNIFYDIYDSAVRESTFSFCKTIFMAEEDVCSFKLMDPIKSKA